MALDDDSPRDAGLSFHDPVHGCITLGPLASLAVDTAPVQRLRRLTQLGTTRFAFPAAEHSRLPHCLGVAHVAGRCARHLAAAGGVDAEQLRRLDVELLELAGLCHDLGHGPWSHTLEMLLCQLLGPNQTWRHEEMSCRLLETVMEQAGLDLDSTHVAFVQDAIDSDHAARLDWRQEQRWRLQVVASTVDADKVDYLARDALLAGVDVAAAAGCTGGNNFSPLLTQHCRVVNGGISFERSQQRRLASLFAARAAAHALVYQHPAAKAAELMLVDVLLEAEPSLRISQRLHDPDEFVQLDESILHPIRAAAAHGGSGGPLGRAAAILARLERRQLYPLAAEATLPPTGPSQQGSAACSADITPALIASHQDANSGVSLSPSHIRLHRACIHHGCGADDPLTRLSLFEPAEPDVTVRADTGLERPAAFIVRKLRAYLARRCSSASEERACLAALRVAFTRALHARYGRSGVTIEQPDADARDARRAAAQRLLQHTLGARLRVQPEPSSSSSSSSSAMAWSPDRQQQRAQREQQQRGTEQSRARRPGRQQRQEVRQQLLAPAPAGPGPEVPARAAAAPAGAREPPSSDAAWLSSQHSSEDGHAASSAES